jgi:hypothetical protein
LAARRWRGLSLHTHSSLHQSSIASAYFGILETVPSALNVANLEAFRKGLLELGYFEKKTTSSSIDQPRASPNGFRSSHPSWYVCRSTSS